MSVVMIIEADRHNIGSEKAAVLPPSTKQCEATAPSCLHFRGRGHVKTAHGSALPKSRLQVEHSHGSSGVTEWLQPSALFSEAQQTGWPSRVRLAPILYLAIKSTCTQNNGRVLVLSGAQKEEASPSLSLPRGGRLG
ncbi:hypothetical protein INR49_015326 [Caranx melampygus]|nr:hypothetical protein INR49_015326 [Caranx melampygus]